MMKMRIRKKRRGHNNHGLGRLLKCACCLKLI
jgi:hypothetical protein